MPYDPRMLQMAQMGIGMMGPQQAGRPKQWWEQPAPEGRRFGQPADDPSNPDDPSKPKQPPQPSLLQMLMLGGKPTYSGTPQPGAASSSWGWLGNMGMPGGAGWGGGGYK